MDYVCELPDQSQLQKQTQFITLKQPLNCFNIVYLQEVIYQDSNFTDKSKQNHKLFLHQRMGEMDKPISITVLMGPASLVVIYCNRLIIVTLENC